MNIEDYVTIAEANALPSVPYAISWLRELCERGRIEARKIGSEKRGQWLIYLPSLLKYIEEMEKLGLKKHNPV